jgi:DNA-binding XRE family transcriptional regulator
MSKVQIIEQDGKAVFAVVPIDIWNRIKDAAEDAEDIADIERFQREDDGVRVPLGVVEAQANGAHPVRAWREHRGLTQDALSEASGISKPYLSQIEGGKRDGTTDTLSKIAKALQVPMDLLVP